MPQSIATLPTVTVTGQRAAPDDDVTLKIDGRSWSGWTEVRITRGIERLPSDFELHLTEFAPNERPIQFALGAPCQLLVGPDVVITGYVDRVIRQFDARSHTVVVTGRSKCADLVDCAAEWPGGQIVGSTVLEIAQKLAAPYGIEVYATGDPGPAIPKFNLMLGETPFAIIERLCRFGQLLAYDDPDGDLILSAVSKRQTASGFREGVNVIRASFAGAMDQRYSEVVSYQQSMATLNDVGEGGNLQATINDDSVPRHRRHIIISETSGGIGWEIAGKRAKYEVSRRFGRGNQVQVTTDSWRDHAGRLYAPNKLALVELPTLQLPSSNLCIGEVTYRSGTGGTQCDLTLMPPQAFEPAPFNVLQLLPFPELADVAVNANPRK
jgi:prophage tail gpP-like protein